MTIPLLAGALHLDDQQRNGGLQAGTTPCSYVRGARRCNSGAADGGCGGRPAGHLLPRSCSLLRRSPASGVREARSDRTQSTAAGGGVRHSFSTNLARPSGTEGDTGLDADRQISLQEVAERLNVHYMTAYRYVRAGRLAARREGGQHQVSAAEVDSSRRYAKARPAGSRASIPNPLVPGDADTTNELTGWHPRSETHNSAS